MIMNFLWGGVWGYSTWACVVCSCQIKNDLAIFKVWHINFIYKPLDHKSVDCSLVKQFIVYFYFSWFSRGCMVLTDAGVFPYLLWNCHWVCNHMQIYTTSCKQWVPRTNCVPHFYSLTLSSGCLPAANVSIVICILLCNYITARVAVVSMKVEWAPRLLR